MQDPSDYGYHIADMGQAEEPGLYYDDESALLVSVDKWGNEWDGISADDDVDIRLIDYRLFVSSRQRALFCNAVTSGLLKFRCRL